MFLKENRDGSIKKCEYMDDRKQRKKYDNADATSPMVSTDVVLISALIGVYEERDVAVVDIPGAYLIADMGDNILVILLSTMVELMVAADPTLYREYISYRKKGEVLMYVHILKALHGCLKSVLLFMRKWLVTWNHTDSR